MPNECDIKFEGKKRMKRMHERRKKVFNWMEITIELTLIPLCLVKKSISNFLIGHTNTKAITKTTSLSFLWNFTMRFYIKFESLAWTKTMEFTREGTESRRRGEYAKWFAVADDI